MQKYNIDDVVYYVVRKGEMFGNANIEMKTDNFFILRSVITDVHQHALGYGYGFAGTSN